MMRSWLNLKTSTVAIIAGTLGAVLSLSVIRPAGQATRAARTADNHPNFSGIWQANNEANWDLQAHSARAGALMQPGVYPYDFAKVPAAPSLPFGAAGGVPASLGVVEGDGQIPYTPDAAAKKKDNGDHWLDRDPELKCYVPGIPRAMYLPYPFQIVQSTNKIEMDFAFSNVARTIHLDKVDQPPLETGMGHSVGRWEGDALIVDVSMLSGGTWFDRAGNFHTESLHLTERFTPTSPDAIHYEVTVEDPAVFTRPWKISMPLYRRLEPNIQLLNYRCAEFVEEFLYGHLRKQPLVKKWEGETMDVAVIRKVPPLDHLYDRIGQ